MHIPDDPLYYEKFYSLPAILVSPTLKHNTAKLACRLLGPVVSGRFRVTALQRSASYFLSDQHWLASPRKSRIRRGAARCLETINARHAIAMEFMSPCKIVSASRANPPMAIPASSSGAIPSSPIPSAKTVSEASNDKEEILVVESIRKSEDTRRNWPFPSRSAALMLRPNLKSLAGRIAACLQRERAAPFERGSYAQSGASRSHLARLAPRENRWPGKFPAIPWA